MSNASPLLAAAQVVDPPGVGAAALSYDHARAFFLPLMGTLGASVTPPPGYILDNRPRPS